MAESRQSRIFTRAGAYVIISGGLAVKFLSIEMTKEIGHYFYNFSIFQFP